MLQVNRSKVNTASNATLNDVIALTSVTSCTCVNTISPTFITSTDSYSVSGDATATGTGSQINLTPTYDVNNDIAQSWANTYLVGKGWNGSDIAAFAYYDDGAGGLTIAPGFINSTTQVFTPTVQTSTQVVEPAFIVSTESVPSPTVVTAQSIEPVRIESTEVLYSPSITTGIVIISPTRIEPTSAVFAPNLQLLLQEIDVNAIIGSELVFFNPTVLGGDSITIPIPDRQTWNKVANYLRTLSFEGADNEVIVRWLLSEGFNGQYNHAWFKYLDSLGYLGSLTDKYAQWRDGDVVSNWILNTAAWDDTGQWVDEAEWKDSI